MEGNKKRNSCCFQIVKKLIICSQQRRIIDGMHGFDSMADIPDFDSTFIHSTFILIFFDVRLVYQLDSWFDVLKLSQALGEVKIKAHFAMNAMFDP